MIEALLHLAGDYTLRVVTGGAALLGALAGTLGSFAVLRRQSLLGDAISHAALPGLALAYLLTGRKDPVVLMAGAAVAGLLATWLLATVIRTTRVKEDTGLGMFLSVFFGAGLVLLTFIQKRPDASQAGLDSFLFGQASALLERDVWFLLAALVVALAVVASLWKELTLLTFDPDSARAAGLPAGALEAVLTVMLVVTIVVGLQTVGVVLMSALVVAPAAAARQWTDRLGRMVVLSALFGAAAGGVGAALSATTPRLPTGPTVVLALGAVALLSILFAPARGILWSLVRQARSRRRLRLEVVLSDLHHLADQHESIAHGHAPGVLAAMAGGRAGVGRCLEELERHGLARRLEGGTWALTEAGHEEAERLDRGGGP